jgi:four helix bundle protein
MSAPDFQSLPPSAKRLAIKARTKQLALDVLNLSDRLHNSAAIRVIRNQLLRSATSVAANYRAACRARSKKEFIAKVGIVIEECDETHFWLELLRERDKPNSSTIQTLVKETNELVSIFVASRLTAECSLRKHNRQSAIGNRQ